MRLTLLPILIAFCLWQLLPAVAMPDTMPDASLKAPKLLPEKSVSTYVPSEVAPGVGLAVNIIYPEKPRYKEGAPLVVVVPGGESASGLDFSAHTAQFGFAEVRFAFPGGGKLGFASSGVYDNRGTDCQRAIRDVLLFASGKLKNSENKLISDVVPVKLATGNVGIIGWSNGGNDAIITLSQYVQELPFVSWLAFYESPLGSIFYPAALGSSFDMIQNRHYRQGSAATGHVLIDFRKLCYQPTGSLNPGQHKKLGQAEIPGVLFFDENGNKKWEEEIEFALPYVTAVGIDKQIYPPMVLEAAKKLGLFGTTPKDWPKTVATMAQADKYFQQRDGSLYVADLAKARPDLLICVFGSVLDHMQRQPDHPHITLNYNGWLANRMRFVRLNPDPVYVGYIAQMHKGNFVDNKPNESVDASTMIDFLEPEGLVPDYLYMDAAACELADRKRSKNLAVVLEEPLLYYTQDQPKDKDKDKPAGAPAGHP
jgi:hypothetical protein